MNPLKWVTSLFSSAGDIIDKFVESPDQKNAAKSELAKIQFDYQKMAIDYETKLLEMQSSIVNAEAQGESWLQRNWRPIVMLFLTTLVGMHWLGFTPENLSAESVADLLGIVKVGLGGYVVGRSVEKAVANYKGGKS